jgi:hypothetical protein
LYDIEHRAQNYADADVADDLGDVEFLEYAGADGAEEYGQAYGQNNADAFARR